MFLSEKCTVSRRQHGKYDVLHIMKQNCNSTKAEDTRGRKPAPIFDSENRQRFIIINPIHY